MIVNSIQITDKLQLEPLPIQQLEENLQQKDSRIWLDLQDYEPGEIEQWLDTLGINGLARRLCLEASDRAGFYPLNNEIIMVIPVLTDSKTSLEPDYITLLCRENQLLTLHRKASIDPQEFMHKISDSESWLPEPSIAGLVSSLLLELSLRCLRHTAMLRKAINSLEERMDRDPNSVESGEIMEQRSALLRIVSIVSDQLPAINDLSAIEKPFFQPKDAQYYIRCTLTNLQAAYGALNWMDGRINALRSGFDMHAQDQTNRRLNMLTILSAIFNPLTFLAGIWGMNFVVMPELQYPYAYPIALSVMVLVGVIMFLFFRRGGWFD